MDSSSTIENQIEIFKSIDNQAIVQVRFDAETVWLNQMQMAELFERNRVVIIPKQGNIFKEGGLDPASGM